MVIRHIFGMALGDRMVRNVRYSDGVNVNESDQNCEGYVRYQNKRNNGC